jgi:hypothetical protein
MLSLYGSLLGDGSEEAALLQALCLFSSCRNHQPSVLRKAHPPSEIGLFLNQEKLREGAFSPTTPAWIFSEPMRPVLKNVTQPTQISKPSKSRLSRAMKARARLRQQHRIRSLFVARNK